MNAKIIFIAVILLITFSGTALAATINYTVGDAAGGTSNNYGVTRYIFVGNPANLTEGTLRIYGRNMTTGNSGVYDYNVPSASCTLYAYNSIAPQNYSFDVALTWGTDARNTYNANFTTSHTISNIQNNAGIVGVADNLSRAVGGAGMFNLRGSCTDSAAYAYSTVYVISPTTGTIVTSGTNMGPYVYLGGYAGGGYYILGEYSWETPPPPTASFTSNVTIGETPLTVQFTDTSINTPTLWAWNFTNVAGNNTPVEFSTLRNPSYVFTTGNYSIKLNATNSYGSNITPLNYWVNVTPPQPPTASFIQSVNPTEILESVTFTDTSTYSPTSWDWGFGDGTPNSSVQNPSHAYSAFGNYLVYLNASNAIGYSQTTGYHSVVNYSIFNQQDIYLDPQYIFTIRVTDSSTGIPISSFSVIDAATGTIYSTTNGTVILQTPYAVIAGWIESDGYSTRGFSKVIDEDTEETYQLTSAPSSNSSQVQYSSAHNVKIIVKDVWKGPIEGVNVTATYVEASGPFDWLFAWIGVISGSGANVQNTTLFGHTGTDGAINFLMVESVQYNITAYKPGIVSKSMLIYPKDDDYTIWTQEMNSSFLYESGYNELDVVRVSVNGTEINTTHGRIMTTYSDRLSQTRFVKIWVNQSTVSGNSTIEHEVTNRTVVGSSDFTSIIDIPGSRDQSYLIHVSYNHTIFGNTTRDFGVTFPPGPISLGLPEDMLHLIGMGLLMFITLAGFSVSKPGETVIVAAFFAWIFFFMRWWTNMAPAYIVITALVSMTVFAILYNIVLRSKKVILS